MDAVMGSLVAVMRFERHRRAVSQDFYRDLSAGQSPDVVVICCSDSRTAPEHIMRADPGALFVQRSVAGLVPPPPGAVERAWLRAYGAVTRVLGLRQLAGAWYGACRDRVSDVALAGFEHPSPAGCARGLTSVHTAHYDIASGEVAFYDETSGEFVSLSNEG